MAHDSFRLRPRCCHAHPFAVAVAAALLSFFPVVCAQSLFDGSRQVLLVVTDGWNSVGGTLQRFERTAGSAPWKAVGAPVPIVVGQKGLAWGRGLHPGGQPGPVKAEGDGKSPAGVFRLGTAFGQSAAPLPGLRMPYLFLGDNVECVDDARSSHYNDLITRQQAKTVDWASSEKMWAEPLYKWGLVVEHNVDPVQAAGGSCIFLHTWRGPASGTAGCTAMEEHSLAALLEWLNPASRPLLVQLPKSEYQRLRKQWQLPAGGASRE
jgi:L,D-peptidoglycan transpeptidase YkuD (ErfK/YbiS/YcfS/YnhG family)